MLAFGVLIVSLPVILLAIALGGAWMEGRRSPYAFGIGRVISNSFSAVGGAPLIFLAASFLLNAPSSLLPPLLGNDLSDWWAVFAGGGIVGAVAWVLLQLALTRLALDTLAGREADAGGAFRLAGRRLLPGLGLVLLSGLVIMVGLAFLIVPGVILLLTWFVVLPAMVGEGRGVFDSFERSAELTRGMRWRLLLLLIVVLVMWSLFAGLGQGIAVAVGGSDGVWPQAIVGAITGTLVGMLQATGAAAVYHEARTAKEGMGNQDLEAVFA